MKQFIIDQTDIQASIAVVLGSGMGGFCDQMDDVILIPYKNIPNYPKSTVRGHAGELAIGSLDNIPLLAAKGRFHFYEGYDIKTITLPVKLFHSRRAGPKSCLCGQLPEVFKRIKRQAPSFKRQAIATIKCFNYKRI